MAIDPNIKKKADDIRNKTYGSEVRKSLASGLEAMSTDVTETISRQMQLGSQWQTISDEMTDKDVISAPEIIAARNGEANLKTRLDKENQEVTAQLAHKVDKSAIWKPPTMNGANLNLSYNDFIQQNYEEQLRLLYPNRITRETVVMDSSNTYPIYKYVFEPKSYSRTISLIAGVHGDEPESYWGLFYLLKEIYKNSSKDPRLQKIRDDVRIIVIPVVSPWNYENFSRENVNGININRQFNVYWREYNANSQGASPFLENEAIAVRDVLTQYADEIDFHLDIHTVPPMYNEAGTYAGYSYVKPYSHLWNPMHTIQEEMVRYWNKEFGFNLSSLYQQSQSSNTTNYAQEILNIPSATLEFASLNFSSVLADSAEMTQAVNWYGNVLIHLINNYQSINKKERYEKIVNEIDYVTIDLSHKKEVYGIRIDSGAPKTLRIINVDKSRQRHIHFKVRMVIAEGVSITFPDNITWSDGVPEDLNRLDIAFESFDGGKSFYATYKQAPSWEIVDLFERSDSDNLGVTPTGEQWVSQSGGLSISENRVINPSGLNSISLINTKSPDVEIDVRINWIEGAVGTFFRGVDDENGLSVYLNREGLQLYKFSNGQTTKLASYDFISSDWTGINLKIITHNDQIRIYLDELLRISVTSEYNKNVTKHGLRFFNSGLSTINNIKIRPYL